MKTVRFHQYGSPEVLALEDAPDPMPGAGEVRIRVAATSFNGIDANIRAGNMQGPIPVKLPHTPGLDVAGVIDRIGDGVTGREVGERVVAFLPLVSAGASAEYAIAAADTVTTAPRDVPLADAGALPVVGLTAWQAIHEHGDLKPGQRILIVGAGGAVGDYAVQLAKITGAHVIAVTSPRSVERVRAAGADQVLDHAVDDATAFVGEPVDMLLNLAPLTPAEFAALADLVRDGGVVVSTTVWMPAPADASRGVRGVDLFVRGDGDQLAELVGLVDRGELHISVAERVPLEDLATLHRRAANGGLASGKTLVTVGAAS